MNFENIPSYEGNQPFIYAFFSLHDQSFAMPILARLYNEGFRIWCSGMSEDSTEFRAAQRMGSCSVMLLFLTEHLIECVSAGEFEAVGALKASKMRIYIRGDEAQIPFAWDKSESRKVFDFSISDEASFWLQIYNNEQLERCRGPWPDKAMQTGALTLDSLDEREVNDACAELEQLISMTPRVDRSGAPVDPNDIPIFAGKGRAEPVTIPEPPPNPEQYRLDRADRGTTAQEREYAAMMEMLDDLVATTREKSETLRAQIEQRREMEQAAAQSAAQAAAPLAFDAEAMLSHSENEADEEVPAEEPVPSEDISAEPSADTITLEEKPASSDSEAGEETADLNDTDDAAEQPMAETAAPVTELIDDASDDEGGVSLELLRAQEEAEAQDRQRAFESAIANAVTKVSSTPVKVAKRGKITLAVRKKKGITVHLTGAKKNITASPAGEKRTTVTAAKRITPTAPPQPATPAENSSETPAPSARKSGTLSRRAQRNAEQVTAAPAVTAPAQQVKGTSVQSTVSPSPAVQSDAADEENVSRRKRKFPHRSEELRARLREFIHSRRNAEEGSAEDAVTTSEEDAQ